MKKQNITLAVAGIFLITIIFAFYVNFNNTLSNTLQSNTSIRLSEIVVPNIMAFEQQMAEQVKKVKTFADFIGKVGIDDKELTFALLNSAVKCNGLLRCAIAYPDGSFITHDNKNVGNVSNSPFFIANMNGDLFITDPTPAVVDSTKTVVLFSVPIMQQGKVIASIIYSYLCDDLDAIFNFEFLDGEGRMLVINSKGNLLMGHSEYLSDGANSLSALRSNCHHTDHEKEDCLKLTKRQGGYRVNVDGLSSPLLVNYDKLAYKDWYMLSMVPETVASQMIYEITTSQRSLSILIALCVLIFLFIILLFFMEKKKNIDSLTGSLTLDSFKKRAKKKLLHANKITYVFIKIDVKNFKLINRIYDYKEGDRVICNIANAIRHVLVNTNSLIARIGTDDFLLLIPYENRENLQLQRSRFIAEFRCLMGPHFTTTVDFPTGQYIVCENDLIRPDINEILEKVNFAHRFAKQQNTEQIVDYIENLEKEALYEKQITDRMEAALANNEFHLYLQPKYKVENETIFGAEALVRWVIRGEIYLHPGEFIPVLEKNGFIVRVDMHIFEKSVKKIRSMLDACIPAIPISVNFSRFHLYNEKFVEELCLITEKYNVPRHLLEIELTESSFFEHVEEIKDLLGKLHEAGFAMSMDDFGSGYSSLALLKDLPVDTLKIDKAFFDATSDTKRRRVVISNIIKMSKELGVSTVAEGIEEETQVIMLRELGCDIIQGYYYAKPMPEHEFFQS